MAEEEVPQDDMEKRCRRKVEKNKYEDNAPEVKEWWKGLFKILESDAAIPPDKRLDVLQEVFSDRILDKVLSILSVEEKQFKEPLEKVKDEVGDAMKKRKFGSENSIIPDTEASICDEKPPALSQDNASGEGRVSSMGGSSYFMEQFGAVPPKKPNPYLNFFKRRPGREAIWRHLPPLRLDEMNLGQQSAYITEMIARNFVEWIVTLGGDEESYLTVEGVVEMFEIGYPVNACKSLRVELKNMPSVPPNVAESAMRPELATRHRLHQEIKRDKRASKKVPHIVAFGRRLPAHMQLKPPDRKAFKHWLYCEVPDKLESMAEVWQGITHLKSTKAYCEHLYYNQPELEPPRYLTEVGMMDIENMANIRKDSSDNDDSFGNILHLTSVMN